MNKHLDPMRAVFFDIGETLINESRVWSQLADLLEIPRMTLFGVLGAVIAERREPRDVFNTVRPDLGWQGVVARYSSETHYLMEDLYPDALPTLEALKRRGYFVGIVGNQPAERLADLLAMHLPADLIATSASWGLRKPEPAFFERVVREAGCSPGEVVYVGDRADNDVMPAAAAGLVPIHIVRGPWGYIQKSWPEAAQARAQITSLAELPGILDLKETGEPSPRQT
jgi:HAD superfamily hydrolase (TIGR01662 family)